MKEGPSCGGAWAMAMAMELEWALSHWGSQFGNAKVRVDAYVSSAKL